jgi:hypothetical protein
MFASTKVVPSLEKARDFARNRMLPAIATQVAFFPSPNGLYVKLNT